MTRKTALAAVLALGVLALGVPLGGCSDDDGSKHGATPLTLGANPPSFDEGTIATVELAAAGVEGPASFAWRQTAGPLVPLTALGPERAVVDVSGLRVAVDTELAFELVLDRTKPRRAEVAVVARTVDATSIPGPGAQIGGATLAADTYFDGATEWLLYGVGGRLESWAAASHAPRPGVLPGVDPTGALAGAADGVPADRRDHGGCPRYVPPAATPGASLPDGPTLGIGGCPYHPPVAAPGAHQPLGGAAAGGPRVAPLGSLALGALVRDVRVTAFQGRAYALLALGARGVGVVDVTGPGPMRLERVVPINHLQRDVAWTDAHGVIRTGNDLESHAAPVVALATDGETLWIANGAFGIHRTPLAALLGPEPRLEDDGTLFLERDVFTLHFAGEEPWGAPRDLHLQRGHLFAALGVGGIAVLDARTLDLVGRYNLYGDPQVTEDWFVRREPALEVQPGGLDPLYGLPTPEQASHEILHVWPHGGAPTPWTDLATTGRYYYDAKAIDVVDAGARSTAYVAYGLAGLVALDVTGYAQAEPWTEPLEPRFLGYLPALPGAGPKPRVGPQAAALLPQEDHDALSRAGVLDVRVEGDVAWFADGLGGLVAAEGARRPQLAWRGPERFYDNDDPILGDGVMGDHQPPWEAVTSFDMSGYDPDAPGSLPAWMRHGPVVATTAATGEAAAGLVLLPGFAPGRADGPDVAQLAGPDGLRVLDAVPAATGAGRLELRAVDACATTDEIGVGLDHTACWAASLGVAQSVAASATALYVADGPHGVLAWRTIDAGGYAADELRLVGNTMPGGTAVAGPGELVYPADHACGVALDPQGGELFAVCAGRGLRRACADPVESGAAAPGAPALLEICASDVFAHGGEAGLRPAPPDEAYGVALRGGVAFVADGRNGLVAYDVSGGERADSARLGHLGGLGVATAVALFRDEAHGGTFALVAAGPSGIAVVDVTDPTAMTLVWTVEPRATGSAGSEPLIGRVLDVAIDGDRAWFSHAPGGVLLYAAGDLVHTATPLPLALFRLQDEAGHAHATGVPRGLVVSRAGGTTTLLVAYDEAGLAWVDWSQATSPRLQRLFPTAGSSRDVATAGGRVYVADLEGGLAAFE